MKLENYLVADLDRKNSNWTFILESPHTSEIQAGYPAAGSSGTIMAIALGLKEKPLGELIDSIDATASGISLLNASSIPLQAKCYGSDIIPPDLLKIIQAKDEYSQDISVKKTRFKNTLESEIGKRIITHFRKRLSRHISGSPHSKYVVCGIEAQCIFEVATGKQGKFHESRRIEFDRKHIPVFYENHPSPKLGVWEEPANVEKMLKFLG